jgi:hypothetical protein
LARAGASAACAIVGVVDGRDSLRIWQGLAHGAWEANALLGELHARIEHEHAWAALEVGGYRVKAMDTVGYYRPRLQGCQTKHYQSAVGKALPAICLGQVGAVGQIGAQRVTVPCRKFSPLVLLKAGCPHLVLRRPKNVTLRRAQAPVYAGRGRPPTRGELVRPLPRTYKGRPIPASAPDATWAWQDLRRDGSACVIEAQLWHEVVLPAQSHWTLADHKLMAHTVWTVVVIAHPDYEEPMVVLMNVALNAQQAYRVATSRWGIEQPPLVAKQLLGLHRQFVWAPDMRFRWPELSLIAAGLLTYVAATVPNPTPTGWWDRQPKPTAGRLRRQLSKVDWRQVPLADQLRKKRSVTRHLPKGFHPALARARAFNRLS